MSLPPVSPPVPPAPPAPPPPPPPWRPGPRTPPAAGARRTRSRPAGRLSARPALPAAILLFLAVAARSGVAERTRLFLDFGAGVLALVSLTATVLWGLAATDRMLLGSGHRLLAQGVHRGLAVAGLGFLVLHIGVKVAEGRTRGTAAAVPFADPAHPLLIGLGTLAGYVFLALAVTGAVRSAFASVGRSRAWRALHLCAYPAWGAALVHGLYAGRPASGWVTAAYAACVAAAAVTLLLRLRLSRGGQGGDA
ncbi:hypothetical protein GCM10010218_56710 [Streptomyces mashuensis]|uniref:Uncharacterized protein n=1 Tax=Streptomyces mashuensis TaxID=33904 RepID=A0A919B9Q1_9ACTN|nr:hypothetical protein [Streptomyces mashuensis]GHF67856.1 hypothetical protein GCM10010218_56710 [Streptomyces mashuensis]